MEPPPPAAPPSTAPAVLTGALAWLHEMPRRPLLPRACALPLAFSIVSLAGSARAQAPDGAALPRAMRLDYAAADRCPEASFFRDRVVLKQPSHVDPFATDVPARLVVSVTRDAAGYRGRWDAYDAAGALVRGHDLGPVWNCHDLVDGLAFGFVLRFDAPAPPPAPTPAPPPAPPPAPTPMPAVVPVAPAVEAPTPPAAPARAGRATLAVSGLLGLATMPTPGGGGAFALGWRAPWWSVSAELRAMLALNAPVDPVHRVSLHRVTGAALPCLHWRWVFGCGALELGALGGSSDADMPASDSAFIATLGGRVGVEIPLGRFLAFRATVDGFGTVKPAIIRISAEPRWETPAGGALVGAGLMALF